MCRTIFIPVGFLIVFVTHMFKSAHVVTKRRASVALSKIEKSPPGKMVHIYADNRPHRQGDYLSQHGISHTSTQRHICNHEAIPSPEIISPSVLCSQADSQVTLRRRVITRLTTPPTCGLMPELVICKHGKVYHHT